MKLPRVMRTSMLGVGPRHPGRPTEYYALLGVDVVIARGVDWGPVKFNPATHRFVHGYQPKLIEFVDDAGTVVGTFDVDPEIDFFEWIRQNALGDLDRKLDERGWYLKRWRVVAPVGSVTILNNVTSIKYENGLTESSWRRVGDDAPQLDALAVAEMTNLELEETREREDRVAIQHMNNVDLIDREIKKRAGIVR